jgi:hypothetical protein
MTSSLLKDSSDDVDAASVQMIKRIINSFKKIYQIIKPKRIYESTTYSNPFYTAYKMLLNPAYTVTNEINERIYRMDYKTNKTKKGLLYVRVSEILARMRVSPACHDSDFDLAKGGVREYGYKMYWHVLTYIPPKNLEFMNYVLACNGMY